MGLNLVMKGSLGTQEGFLLLMRVAEFVLLGCWWVKRSCSRQGPWVDCFYREPRWEMKPGTNVNSLHPPRASLCPCSQATSVPCLHPCPPPDPRQWQGPSLPLPAPPLGLGRGCRAAWVSRMPETCTKAPGVWCGPSMPGSCWPLGSYLLPADLVLLSCTLRGDIINSPVGTLHWIPTFSVW